MPALYTAKADVTNAAQDAGYVLPSDSGGAPTALDRLIERAQLDIDSLLGPWTIIESGTYAGLKLDVTTLDYAQRAALARATVQQVLYRLEMGEQFFVRPQFDSVSGPEFSTEGAAPRVGPAARQELSGLGLIRKSFGVGASRPVPSWLDFSYNIEPDFGTVFGGLRRP